MTRAREQIISLQDTPYYHCMARCVRRAFLFGDDFVTRKNYDHRKQWVVNKIAELSEIFAIDICAYAVMSNHYHLVLKVNVEEGNELSDYDVLKRWTQLFNGNILAKKVLSGKEGLEPGEDFVLAELVKKWRGRLTDISWFMRCLNETIAKMANEEEGIRGRFWEGRFKSQALLDDVAVIACMAYVDLNPVRAAMANTPEESDFTSIQERIRTFGDRKVGRPRKAAVNAQRSEKREKNEGGKFAGLRDLDDETVKDVRLAKFSDVPFHEVFGVGDAVDRGGDHNGSSIKESTGRAAQKLLDPVSRGEGSISLPFYWQDYLVLLDWTGRAIRDDKRGYIPSDAPNILLRLGVHPDNWLDALPKLEEQFHEFMGREDSMKRLGEKLEKKWLKGVGLARRLFGGAEPGVGSVI